MKTSDFNYHLPAERIAQTPLEPRHASRLLVLDRMTGQMEHSTFWQIGAYLRAGDVLVINQTRVLPARIYARKPSGGRVELLLLRRLDDTTWEALVGGKGINAGKVLALEQEGPAVEVLQTLDGARRLLRFAHPVESHLQRAGQMPLPPYIHTPLEDPERYQTVYARHPGSAAAPTAGLHFTPQLISRLRQQGILFASVTLHVGLDTFAPVTEDDPAAHHIHTEWCQVAAEDAEVINSASRKGGRVIAVGTTSARTLETAANAAAGGERVTAFSGPTGLFILPGYRFRAVDALVTNFHLPRSTLLMMVSAFAGRDLILNTYQEAVQDGYRFYSFGDAMLIV